VPIPLRAPDPDARLDLQALVHRVYDGARYEADIYQNEPHPALSKVDAEWARGLIPKRH
jgi:hypothetical protein